MSDECGVCLEAFVDASVVDSCKHKFCFKRILEWVKKKPECPYCRSKFESVYHVIDGTEVVTIINEKIVADFDTSIFLV